VNRLSLTILSAASLLVLAAPAHPVLSAGDDAKALIAQLDKADDRKLKQVLAELKQLGSGGVEGLLVASRHKKAWVRATAWRWIGELGPAARAALEPAATLASPHRGRSSVGRARPSQGLAGMYPPTETPSQVALAA